MSVNVNLRMTQRLVERMDACIAARGLTRHDFIRHAVEREVSQIEARSDRRVRERLAYAEARARAAVRAEEDSPAAARPA